MKKHFRTAIFVGILSSLLTGYSSSSAFAESDPKCATNSQVKHVHTKTNVRHVNKSPKQNMSFHQKVRAAQMRLSDLGYFVGYYDGAIGPKTKKAIISFQRSHHLKANGALTDKTFETLCMTDYLGHHYYLASVTDPKGTVFHAGYPYNQPGHINFETGAWVVKRSDR